MPVWNPWHGCHKYSPGCLNCYVYRRDARYDKDSSIVTKTRNFDLPLKRNREGVYKLQKEHEDVYTCMTSDFFVEDADPWRADIWNIIRTRWDLSFFIITKRIERFHNCIPPDWGDDGYENVTICCTAENQACADRRLPIFLEAPIRRKYIATEPLLEPLNLTPYLGPDICGVVSGGESGLEARPCNYDWILDIRRQCVEKNVPFWFKQTGANFIKDGKRYKIPRQIQHSQARKAGINYKWKPLKF